MKVTEVLKDKGGGAGDKKKGGKRGAGSKGKSILSLRFLSSILQRLFRYLFTSIFFFFLMYLEEWYIFTN